MWAASALRRSVIGKAGCGLMDCACQAESNAASKEWFRTAGNGVGAGRLCVVSIVPPHWAGIGDGRGIWRGCLFSELLLDGRVGRAEVLARVCAWPRLPLANALACDTEEGVAVRVSAPPLPKRSIDLV